MTLQDSYNNFESSNSSLIALINNIIANGEIKEEDKALLTTLKENYNNSFINVKEDLQDAQNIKLEKKIIEVQSKNIKQQDVFNALTNFGQSQGFFIDEETNEVYINAEFIQTKGWKVIDDEGNTMLEFDANNNRLVVSGDIKGSMIIGSTFQNEEDTFGIDANGNITGATIICENMNVDNLISANIPTALPSSLNITVASGETITQYLDNLPLNLNGYTVNIYLSSDTTENLELRRHSNGIVNIFLCGYTLKGTIRGNFNNCIYNIYGGNSTSSETVGNIMPNVGYLIGIYYYSIVFINCPNINLYNLKIYGDKVNTSSSVGIGGQNKSKINMENIAFVGCYYNCRTYSMAEVYCQSSKGTSSGNSWSAGTGSKITLNGVSQAGGGSNTFTSGNGQIISTGVTFATTSETGSNNNDASNTTTRIETFKPNSCATYRSTKYNDWATGVCRQGNWGYGDCNGAWFFGTQFEEVKGKTITKVTITVTRGSGVGYSSAVSHVFQAHSHSSRPSGMPNYTSCNKTLSLAWGETGTVTITDTDILNGISAGTIKGFGIKSAYTNSNYSALTNGTVKIYYTE